MKFGQFDIAAENVLYLKFAEFPGGESRVLCLALNRDSAHVSEHDMSMREYTLDFKSKAEYDKMMSDAVSALTGIETKTETEEAEIWRVFGLNQSLHNYDSNTFVRVTKISNVRMCKWMDEMSSAF